jgi:hypothetical protein
LALLANPYGWRWFVFVWDVMGQLKVGLGATVNEWKPPAVKLVPFYWVAFCLAGVVMVESIIRRRSRMRFWIPAVFVMAVWTSFHIRSTALLSFVALPMVGEWIMEYRRTLICKQAPLFAMAGILCLFPIKAIWNPPLYKVSWHKFPVGACAFVQRVGLAGKLYNTYHFGGYIQWILGPRQKTFMDGRYLSFPLAIEKSNDFRNLLITGQATAWKQRLAAYDIEIAIVEYYNTFWELFQSHTKTPEALYSDRLFPLPEWALVYWDDTALVFVRRQTKWAPLIQAHDYRAFKPYRTDRFSSPLMQTDDFVKALRSELLRHREEVPASIWRDTIEKDLLKGVTL